MKEKEMRIFIASTTTKLQCSKGIEVIHQPMRLMLPTHNSFIAADIAKNISLYSPKLYNRYDDIVAMNVLAFDEMRNYESTEFVARKVDYESFDIEVNNYPEFGNLCAAITDSFFENITLECDRDEGCRTCHKHNVTCFFDEEEIEDDEE